MKVQTITQSGSVFTIVTTCGKHYVHCAGESTVLSFKYTNGKTLRRELSGKNVLAFVRAAIARFSATAAAEPVAEPTAELELNAEASYEVKVNGEKTRLTIRDCSHFSGGYLLQADFLDLPLDKAFIRNFPVCDTLEEAQTMALVVFAHDYHLPS